MRKKLAILLSAAMLLTLIPTPTFALPVEESAVEAVVEAADLTGTPAAEVSQEEIPAEAAEEKAEEVKTEEVKTEETQTENTPAEGAEGETTAQTNAVEEPAAQEAVTEEAVETEELTGARQIAYLKDEQQIEGTNIVVSVDGEFSAENGETIPAGAQLKLQASLVDNAAVLRKIDNTIPEEEPVDQTQYAFDIKITDADGNHYQPVDTASIQFSFADSEDVTENAEVYHVSNLFKEAEKIEQVTVDSAQGTVGAEAPGFSYWVVVFKDIQEGNIPLYTLGKGEVVMVSDLMLQLGWVNSFEKATLSKVEIYDKSGQAPREPSDISIIKAGAEYFVSARDIDAESLDNQYPYDLIITWADYSLDYKTISKTLHLTTQTNAWSEYDLTVGNEQVGSDASGYGSDANSWQFIPYGDHTGTLILRDCTLDQVFASRSDIPGMISVNCLEDGIELKQLRIIIDGNVEIHNAEGKFGIYVNNDRDTDLFISGRGEAEDKLTILLNGSDESGNSGGIYVPDGLSIGTFAGIGYDTVDIDIHPAVENEYTKNRVYGICAEELIIDGGSINVLAQNTKNYPSTAINVSEYEQLGGEVTAVGGDSFKSESYGVKAGDLSLAGGKLSVGAGGPATQCAYGAYVDSDLAWESRSQEGKLSLLQGTSLDVTKVLAGSSDAYVRAPLEIMATGIAADFITNSGDIRVAPEEYVEYVAANILFNANDDRTGNMKAEATGIKAGLFSNAKGSVTVQNVNAQAVQNDKDCQVKSRVEAKATGIFVEDLFTTDGGSVTVGVYETEESSIYSEAINIGTYSELPRVGNTYTYNYGIQADRGIEITNGAEVNVCSGEGNIDLRQIGDYESFGTYCKLYEYGLYTDGFLHISDEDTEVNVAALGHQTPQATSSEIKNVAVYVGGDVTEQQEAVRITDNAVLGAVVGDDLSHSSESVGLWVGESGNPSHASRIHLTDEAALNVTVGTAAENYGIWTYCTDKEKAIYIDSKDAGINVCLESGYESTGIGSEDGGITIDVEEFNPGLINISVEINAREDLPYYREFCGIYVPNYYNNNGSLEIHHIHHTAADLITVGENVGMYIGENFHVKGDSYTNVDCGDKIKGSIENYGVQFSDLSPLPENKRAATPYFIIQDNAVIESYNYKGAAFSHPVQQNVYSVPGEDGSTYIPQVSYGNNPQDPFMNVSDISVLPSKYCENAYVKIENDKHYDIWVGGRRVTDSNKNDIGGNGTIGTASYIPETNTLILDNYHFTGNGRAVDNSVNAGIYSSIESPLYVIVKGDCGFELTGNGGSQVYGIKTTGSLFISSEEEAESKPSLELDLSGETASDTGMNIGICVLPENTTFGGFGASELEIDGVDVTITAGAGGKTMGIYSSDGIDLDNADLEIGGADAITDNESVGIWTMNRVYAYQSKITVLPEKMSVGIEADSLVVDYCDDAETAVDATGINYGILVEYLDLRSGQIDAAALTENNPIALLVTDGSPDGEDYLTYPKYVALVSDNILPTEIIREHMYDGRTYYVPQIPYDLLTTGERADFAGKLYNEHNYVHLEKGHFIDYTVTDVNPFDETVPVPNGEIFDVVRYDQLFTDDQTGSRYVLLDKQYDYVGEYTQLEQYAWLAATESDATPSSLVLPNNLDPFTMDQIHVGDEYATIFSLANGNVSDNESRFWAYWTYRSLITLDATPSTIAPEKQYAMAYRGFPMPQTGSTDPTQVLASPSQNLASPSRVGYNFEGFSDRWGNSYYDKQMESTNSWNKFGYRHNLFAQWDAEIYEVTLDLDYSNQVLGTIYPEYDATPSDLFDQAFATPSRVGYRFLGFFDKKSSETGSKKYFDANGQALGLWDIDPNPEDKSDEPEEVTLYAHWEPIADHTILSFNTAGGTGGQTGTITAIVGQPMPGPVSVPTRANYTFLGYYDSTSGGTQYYTAGGYSARNWNKSSTPVFTLYAHWKSNGGGGGGGTGGGGGSTKAVITRAAGTITGNWQYLPSTDQWTFTSDEGRVFRNEWAYVYNPYAKDARYVNTWFFFNANGIMLTGYQWIPSLAGGYRLYYLHPTADGIRGRMYNNERTPEGYTTDANGWVYINGVLQTR